MISVGRHSRDYAKSIAIVFLLLFTSGLSTGFAQVEQLPESSLSKPVAVIASADLQSTPCSVPVDTQMPLAESHGRFVTPVLVNRQKLTMLIDSGAGGTALSPRIASTLDLDEDTSKRVRLSGVGGEMNVQHPLILPFIQFGSVSLEDYDVLTANIVRPEQESDPAAAVGLVGADLLSRFDVEFDFPARTLTLYRASGCTGNFVPWQGRYQAFKALRTPRNAFIIPVFLNGVAVRALVDTGSNISSVSRDAAVKVGVDAQTLASETAGTFVGSRGNVVSAHKHMFESMTVGAATFKNARIFVQDSSFPDVDMLLGMDFLRWRKLWISYSTNQIFIQFVPHASTNRVQGAGSDALVRPQVE